MSRKAGKKKPLAPLAKGQLWKVDQAYIHIMDIGKRLIHYRMLKHAGQMGVKARMTGIPTLQGYLDANQAWLVKGSG